MFDQSDESEHELVAVLSFYSKEEAMDALNAGRYKCGLEMVIDRLRARQKWENSDTISCDEVRFLVNEYLLDDDCCGGSGCKPDYLRLSGPLRQVYRVVQFIVGSGPDNCKRYSLMADGLSLLLSLRDRLKNPKENPNL